MTEDIFQGRVFVVGHANDTRCVSREIGRRSTSITVRKENCGVVTIRSVIFFFRIFNKKNFFLKKHI